ncbi:hypothetical protein Mal15_42700 [Stieleria maiorica]|uniref:Helix-turn-helix domain-containing protein n=1 Tax=Stieleria maiorica TaxID=2795974 RepID=A0A5B9MJQ4_9BACT|nr:hypothetical protein Mal15_42700 [Stieleria maiorica]
MDLDLDLFAANESQVAALHAAQSKRPANRKTPKRETRRSVDLPRHGKGERFIRGPIPLEWMKLASKCGNRSEAVAMLLWYAASLQRSNPVRLTKTILDELGVHTRTAKRVLLKMSDFGLVDARFQRGRSPIVTIKSPESKVFPNND